ncbi:glucose-6-phosphate dehydrogenase [Candidatus Neomarinimicrobiota bacterium]
MNKPENCILVIFGGTGDLTKRKLLPALFDLYSRKLLPSKIAVIGTGRSDYSDEQYRNNMFEALIQFYNKQKADGEQFKIFLKNIHYQQGNSRNLDDYLILKERITGLDDMINSNGNYIFYLATSPALFSVISENISRVGLNKQRDGWKRLVVEKPFGYNIDSARSLNQTLLNIFDEKQIYRIDHYLGKETVQNILAFRFANGIFEPLWNRNYIHHIECTGAENIGVGTRGEYYDTSGVLRDMVQNHLLQVIATIAMEPPAKFDADSVRNEKVKVFQSLCPIKPENVEKQVYRGQYTSSVVGGNKLRGYREEDGVPVESQTETYVAIKFFIDSWRWGGVPFFIRSGKRLAKRETKIVIHFKKTPHILFKGDNSDDIKDNQLIIRIQPEEGISLRFGMKQPGSGFKITSVDMDFSYSDINDISLPEAYERLLLDVIMGDPTLFARADAVEACWYFLKPILDNWNEKSNSPLYGYPAGSWGPKIASKLFGDYGEDWNQSLLTEEVQGNFEIL